MTAMHAINGDLSRRACVDTAAMDWTASPSNTVWRKRVHLVGPLESGQVTSVVRYAPNSTFHTHEHPDGEEILVLDGVFSDEHGDWPAGTYLLNPEGFRHAPFSRQGCTLFVKLRQYPGRARAHVALRTASVPWRTSTLVGVSTRLLYAQAGFTDTMRLERWERGTARGHVDYAAGAELFVLEGAFEDEHGRYGVGTWLRLPAGSRHRPVPLEGCVLYIKEGGFSYLKGG
jgi:anti-sigma factor ChrR (cupin superfamily)